MLETVDPSKIMSVLFIAASPANATTTNQQSATGNSFDRMAIQA